jgi:hypothetical protein
MKKLIFFTLFAGLLSACTAKSPSQDIPQGIAQNTDEGMIVGTIAIENVKPIYNQYHFHYLAESQEDITTKQMITIRPQQTVSMKLNPDFNDQNKAVYFFSATVKKGTYYFTMLRTNNNGLGYTNQGNIPLYIKFNIEKGKVNYLGEMYYNPTTNKVTISDQSKRDLPLIKQRWPYLTIENTHNQ